jgi:hypothetical protein
MMTMLEDVRLALRQICRALGLPGDVATTVSLIVLGVALNVVALRAVEYAGIGSHRGHERTGLQCAARTELKVMRTVVASTLKKIGGSGRRWCVARQWLVDQRAKGTGFHVEVGIAWAAPTGNTGCDVVIASNPTRKAAIALVEC